MVPLAQTKLSFGASILGYLNFLNKHLYYFVIFVNLINHDVLFLSDDVTDRSMTIVKVFQSSVVAMVTALRRVLFASINLCGLF